jgi:uncharacterized protein YjcR
MSLFENKTDLKRQISELEVQVLKLEATIEVKDKEIEFYKARGDKYMNNLDSRGEGTQQLFELAQKILQQVVDSKCKESK